jgi:hypothetical protein
MDAVTRREWTFFAALAAAGALLAALRPEKAIDFRVYFENARHYFGAGAAMYGPKSGTGWVGGVYRYPPIFLDLFRPLAALPLALGAALWAAGKALAGGWLAIRLRRRWGLSSVAAFWPGLLLVAAYFIQELRYGNAQFYIVALVMAAFLVGEASPGWGGFWLGWAAALKVWPLFFFPCLPLRRRGRMALAACASGVGWTLLPILWRGGRAQFALLGQWLAQERSIAARNARLGGFWYPGQSLHDVMARYLMRIDYARLPDANYPQVAWLHATAAAVQHAWVAAAVLLTAAMFLWLWRATGPEDGVVAFLFCALMVLEPHVHRLVLETLLWPALWLAAEWRHGRLSPAARAGYGLAVAVAVLEPLVPGSARQRVMQAYATDFWFVVLPLAAITGWAAWKQRPRGALRQMADGQATEAGAN